MELSWQKTTTLSESVDGEKLSAMQLRLLQIWQKGRLRQMNFWHFFCKNIRSGSKLVTKTNGERILIHKQVFHYLNLFNYRMSIVLFLYRIGDEIIKC